MINKDLIERIKLYEGFSKYPYECPAGKVTIGYGHNIEANGLSQKVCEHILMDDISIAEEQLYDWYSGFDIFPEPVKEVLIDMCFNMGLSTLKTFKKMHVALIEKNYNLAATELLDSKYAKQVGRRADENATLIRSCSQ